MTDQFRRAILHAVTPERKAIWHILDHLGLSSRERDVEIRVNTELEETKQELDKLVDQGYIKVRWHAEERGSLARISLTDKGARLAQEGLAEVAEETRATGKGDPGLRPISFEGADEVFVPTVTLRAFQKKAREHGLSRTLSDEALQNLDPNAHHRISAAFMHTSSEGYRNVRASTTCYAKDGTNYLTHIDFLLPDWDMLMVPHKQHQRRQAHESFLAAQQNAHALTPPVWEATHSYNPAHTTQAFFHLHLSQWDRVGYSGPIELPRVLVRPGEDTHIRARGDVTNFLEHPRTIGNAAAAILLQDAHPIVVDPEWVDIQDEYTLEEAWAFGQRVKLPYDVVYLDFEAAGGRLPEVEVYNNKRAYMPGCLLWKNGERLVIAPVGGREVLDRMLPTDFAAGANPYEVVGTVTLGGKCDIGEQIVPTIDGQPLEGEDGPLGVVGMYRLPMQFGGIRADALGYDLAAYGRANDMWQVEAGYIPGYVTLPLTPQEGWRFEDEELGEPGYSWADRWVRTTTRMAVKGLTVLGLLDNENVELRESTGISRQVRRQAERKGYGIADEITIIRNTKYVDGKHEPSGRTIEYSHQFPVRRHEQHHGPHTPAYRAAPHKARPCPRCGSCRRFIVESYVKGPEDAPYKSKTYRYRK